MSSLKVVAEKVVEIGQLTGGLLTHAVARLDGSANKQARQLSLVEIDWRLDDALKALRGELTSASQAGNRRAATLKEVNGDTIYRARFLTADSSAEMILSEKASTCYGATLAKLANSFGGRVATRAEHKAFVDDLFDKVRHGLLNKADAYALKLYQDRRIRDKSGSMWIEDLCIRETNNLRGNGHPFENLPPRPVAIIRVPSVDK